MIAYTDCFPVCKKGKEGLSHRFRKEDLVPEPYTVEEDGTVTFCLYYPEARSVDLKLYATEVSELSLEKKEDLWYGQAKGLEGFVAIAIEVDGDPVLNKKMPVGFYGSRKLNFIEREIRNDVYLLVVPPVPLFNDVLIDLQGV